MIHRRQLLGFAVQSACGTALAGCGAGLAACLVSLGGCSSGGTPPVADANRFHLAEEPAGAVLVAEARTAPVTADQLVVLGRISGGEHSPWDPGRASFLLSDPSAVIETHGDHGQPGHDHSNCPFCKQAAQASGNFALVRFLDDRGEILPIDARKLLGIRENQMVVVQGRADRDELGNLVISANGIYIRR